jgi:hypothetical protein
MGSQPEEGNDNGQQFGLGIRNIHMIRNTRILVSNIRVGLVPVRHRGFDYGKRT